MRMLLRQRVFSWLDSYDIYDDAGNVLYTVRGQLSWGHCLQISDAAGRHVGTVREAVLTWLPRFDLYVGDTYVGCIQKKFTLFSPAFTLDVNGWTISGNWLEWDYAIQDASGRCVATIAKQLLNWSDTYAIDVADEADALAALMVVLAIDAEKCSRS